MTSFAASSHTQCLHDRRGFTLIELLIVIAIISILGGVVFVALDPLTRFKDTRDAARLSDVTALIGAIKIDQVDNGGAYLSAIASMTTSSVYMLVNGSLMTAGCDDKNSFCDTPVSGDANCVDVSGLIDEGYLGRVPVSPSGAGSWDDGSNAGNDGTGYTIQSATTGIITIRACESENTSEIEIAR